MATKKATQMTLRVKSLIIEDTLARKSINALNNDVKELREQVEILQKQLLKAQSAVISSKEILDKVFSN